MRIAVAIHDEPVWVIPDAQVDRIRRLLPDDVVTHAPGQESRLQALAGAEVLFATRISADEFAATRTIRWMHSSAVGVGPLLPPAVVASHVVVSSSRGVHSDAIAEHAIALVLALRRAIHTAVVRQQTQEWAQVELSTISVRPLAGLQVLVLGLGSIGERIAALASGLGMRVSGVRKRPELPAPAGVSRVVAPERLIEALREADVVILALPRTDETRALIGHEEIAAMKSDALIINVARGGLVDEGALVEALEAGRLGGAGLDAFRREPLPADHPFWRLPNVLLTPHTAAFSGDYWTAVVDLFLANVGRFRRGEPLLNVVDKTRGY